ncbi:MAG: GNAT family N-acetyltransferase [bacterium]|nr:GNAT family N-acetyltransferase [bacterium]
MRALADSPDSFGSTLDWERAKPDQWWLERLVSAEDSDLPLVAEVDGRAVGLAWGKLSTTQRDCANVYQMWVDPEVRGQGIGRMLLAAIVDWARTLGVSRLDLTVARPNTVAVQLYEGSGFHAIGEPQPLRPGSAVLAQAMTRQLETLTGRADP